MVYCADCGKTLALCRTTSWERKQDNYVCTTYKQKKGACSAHYIREVVLSALVLENLRKVISFAHDYEDDFVCRITVNKMTAQIEDQRKAKRQLEQQMRRISELDTIIKRLHEDNSIGKLSVERFMKMTADYEHEQKALTASVAADSGDE
ncbi:MAG: zinc ribbon domain-containing protein [Lacrimispora sp.]